MIFNQWKQGQCKGYSFLAALKIMKPDIDHGKIISELKQTDNLLTNQKAAKWFIDKWYIKWIKYLRPYQIKIVIKRVPIVAWLANAKWNNTPPYIIEWDNDGSHSICVTEDIWSLYKIQNSWWEEWWDKWYCYLKKEDSNRLQSPCYLIL